MAKPTTGHTERFSAANAKAAPDGRLFAATCDRNGPPLIAALAPWMNGRVGRVLEIGCGTGQHAANCAAAFPHLEWQATDIYEEHLASASAWAAHLRQNTPTPILLDAAADWSGDVGSVSAVISSNVIHIAPWAVAKGIVAGAGKALAPGGVLIFYGPFKVSGRHIGDGNAMFDARLRDDNPDWGVRDVDDILAQGADAGLDFASLQAMPANNRLLVLRKMR